MRSRRRHLHSVYIILILEIVLTTCCLHQMTVQKDVPQYILSPGYDTGQYSNNLHCKWNISTLTSHRIQLSIVSFDIEYSTNCMWDRVEVYNGSCGTSTGSRHCGSGLDHTFKSSQNTICLEFVSDTSVVRPGFKIKASIIKENDSSQRSSLPISASSTSATSIQLSTTESSFPVSSTHSSSTQHYSAIQTILVTPATVTAGNTNEPIEMCFNTARTESGSLGYIVSPGFGQQAFYQNNQDCELQIYNFNNFIIEITFLEFDVEYHSTCKWDNLTLSEVRANTRVTFKKLCGYTLPLGFNSTADRIILKFRSDHIIGRRGFKLQYRVKVLPIVPTTSYLRAHTQSTMSESQPHTDEVTLNPSISESKLTFSSYDVSTFISSSYLHDMTSDGPMFSGWSSASVRLATSISANIAIEEMCKEETNIEINSVYYVTSPNYVLGQNYPVNKQCSLRLTSTNANHILKIDFVEFVTENHLNCVWDSVKIYNGPSASSSLIGSYCGVHTGKTVNSEGAAVYVEFISDSSVTNVGFKFKISTQSIHEDSTITTSTPLLFYSSSLHAVTSSSILEITSSLPVISSLSSWKPSSVETPTSSTVMTTAASVEDVFLCSSQHDVSITNNITVFSPNYHQNDKYPNNKDCSLSVECAGAQYLRIIFMDFEVENHYSCVWDHLSIYSGKSNTAPLLGRYCGSISGQLIQTNGFAVYLRFVTDQTVQLRGFRLVIAPVIGDPVLSSSSFFSTTGKTLNTTPLSTKTISHRPISISTVQPLHTSVSRASEVFLTVSPTPSSSMTLSTSRQQAETSTTTRVLSTTDQPTPTSRPTTVTMHPGMQTVQIVDVLNIVSVNYGIGDYPLNMVSQLQVVTTNGARIQSEVKEIDIESNPVCLYDRLEIYDGPNDQSPLLAKYCGISSTQGTVFSSGNIIYLLFRSDSSITRTGFRMLLKTIREESSTAETTTTSTNTTTTIPTTTTSSTTTTSIPTTTIPTTTTSTSTSTTIPTTTASTTTTTTIPTTTTSTSTSTTIPTTTTSTTTTTTIPTTTTSTSTSTTIPTTTTSTTTTTTIPTTTTSTSTSTTIPTTTTSTTTITTIPTTTTSTSTSTTIPTTTTSTTTTTTIPTTTSSTTTSASATTTSTSTTTTDVKTSAIYATTTTTTSTTTTHHLPIECAGIPKVFTASRGIIYIPEKEKQELPGNLSCKWVILAPPHETIYLQFLSFNVPCETGNVTVYDGISESAALLEGYCGHDIPMNTSSSGTSMSIHLLVGKPANVYFIRADYVTVQMERPSNDCPSGKFPCSSGKCIHPSWLCDGEADCPDKDDEQSCGECLPDQFRCNNGQCLEGLRQCDGHTDCSQGEDETRCVKLQESNQTVLVMYNGIWYPVCADYWNRSSSDAVCKYASFGDTDYIETKPSAASVMMAWKGLQDDENLHKSFEPVSSCPSKSEVILHCSSNECGTRSPNVMVPYIFGGTKSYLGQWPWMASIKIDNLFICGGSLISPQWVVTASHCVETIQFKPYLINVLFGNILANPSTPNYYKVTEVIRHPQNDHIYNADIALLRLQKPVTFTEYVRPVCLRGETHFLNEHSLCYVAGWGVKNMADFYTTTLPDYLHHAKVKLYNQTNCMKSYQSGKIKHSMICAGYQLGGIDTCKGDSGGPLMCKAGIRWILTGVTSWGDTPCGQPRKPGVYTRVEKFKSWIIDTSQSHGVSPNCTFETNDLCGYTEHSTSNYMWTRRSGKPTLDHTYSSVSGHFLYAETTNTINLHGNEAILRLPLLELNREKCMSLALQFYGSSPNMALQVRASDGNKDNGTIFSSSPFGSDWKEISIEIPHKYNQIEIIAICGIYENSGIAIDDVTIRNGPCLDFNDEECTFDDGHQCLYSNNDDDIYDWEILQSPTDSGYYFGFNLYNKVNSGFATISSVVIESLVPKCLSFRYRICPGYCGRLTVYTQTNFGGTFLMRDPKWTRQSSDCSSWSLAFIDIPDTTHVLSIAFEATNVNSNGIVGIDDIKMTTGNCIQDV